MFSSSFCFSARARIYVRKIHLHNRFDFGSIVSFGDLTANLPVRAWPTLPMPAHTRAVKNYKNIFTHTHINIIEKGRIESPTCSFIFTAVEEEGGIKWESTHFLHSHKLLPLYRFDKKGIKNLDTAVMIFFKHPASESSLLYKRAWHKIAFFS